MKAIVMFKNGNAPKYVTDFPEPILKNDDEVIISMKAAAVKHLDRSVASGKHYSAKGDLSQAKVTGGDGVGTLADGTRVFAFGAGMMAEKAVVNKRAIIKLPEGIDDAIAAALPNAVVGSAMALRFRAMMKPGETVFINGATGFTGRVAVQVARHYGARHVIVSGRNERSLEELFDLGATEIVSLKQSDEQIAAQIKEIHKRTPIGVIVDYLWGHAAELILEALKGNGMFTPRTRFVSVGSMAGDEVRLSAGILRSTDLQLCGSGMGSWTQEEVGVMLTQIVPEFLQLAVDGKMKIETEVVAMEKIGAVWEMDVAGGKRVVVRM